MIRPTICIPKSRSRFGRTETSVHARGASKPVATATLKINTWVSGSYACLPVHDSFIVHHEMRDVLEDTMKAVFRDMFGVVSKVEFDMGEGEIVEPREDPIEPDIAGLLEPDGHEGRLQAFRASREPL
jgi:hypothetical protein